MSSTSIQESNLFWRFSLIKILSMSDALFVVILVGHVIVGSILYSSKVSRNRPVGGVVHPLRGLSYDLTPT